MIFIWDLPGSVVKNARDSICWHFLASAGSFVPLVIKKVGLSMGNGDSPMCSFSPSSKFNNRHLKQMPASKGSGSIPKSHYTTRCRLVPESVLVRRMADISTGDFAGSDSDGVVIRP